jgi:hypothetical protein
MLEWEEHYRNILNPNRSSNTGSSSSLHNFLFAWQMESTQVPSHFQEPTTLLNDSLVDHSDFWSLPEDRSEDMDFIPSMKYLAAHVSQFEEDGFNQDVFATAASTSYDFLRDLVSTPEPPPSSEHQDSRSDCKPQQLKGEVDDIDNDYNLTSITKQASALTMLSPDAPSFTPSFKLGISPNMNYPIPANTNIVSSADMSDNAESVTDSSMGFKKWNRSYLNPAALSFDSPPFEETMPPSTAAARGSQSKPPSTSSNRVQGRGSHSVAGDKGDSS